MTQLTYQTSPYQSAGSAYRTQAVGTAGPAQLVIMLYDGALGSIAKAKAGMAVGGRESIEMVNTELNRAQNIITELQLSLDHERGGTIAGNLAAIYDFCLTQLTEANLSKDPISLDGVTSHLAELREAFADAAAQVAAGAA